MMLTLEEIAGVQARIHRLPGRPPFMLANDAAEIYGTSAKYVTRAVKRNLNRFPERFAFLLTAEENSILLTGSGAILAPLPGEKWSQTMTTSQGWRTDLAPLAFSHAGAYALSAVLKTDIAAEVSVVVFEAFAEMEARALAEAKAALLLLQSEARGRRSLRSHIVDAQREGWSFEQLWRERGCARIKLAAEIRKCVWLKLIPEALTGTPADGGQFSMFGEA